MKLYKWSIYTYTHDVICVCARSVNEARDKVLNTYKFIRYEDIKGEPEEYDNFICIDSKDY